MPKVAVGKKTCGVYMMKTQCLSSDIISSLPLNIIETILTFMPIRDAVKTSILSKKWRYCWMTMPKLIFDQNQVHGYNYNYRHSVKSKLVSAIFHVLFIHSGPTILEFKLPIIDLDLVTEFDAIILYLSRRTNVKDLIIYNSNNFYKLPNPFFSLQGLEYIRLRHCNFEPPVTFNGFNKLKSLWFENVQVSVKALQHFLSNCPLLEDMCLYLAVGGMPKKLPTWLHLRHVTLDLCLREHDVISSALCIIRSAPNLQRLNFMMNDNVNLPIQGSSMKLVDFQDGLSLTFDHLKHFEILISRNYVFMMEFVKLVMAKSPVLEIARTELKTNISVEEELKICKEMINLPFSRASPSSKLIIERPKTSSRRR
ncbi:F-box/FBD/LRR-repeat protein At1g13570-like [Rutidosis leptorrhynchoides]|uniref:F-box/FBD/LRR-repeat protein At1g13570-like n=1 Tax=Rutidosis leptorrhynchoides TaxID=125765 RepID=UPI003A99A3F2